MDLDQFQALGLTVENKLKQSDARERAVPQVFTIDTVCEWTSRADQEVRLGMTRPDGPMSTPSPTTRLARDCSHYIAHALSKVKLCRIVYVQRYRTLRGSRLVESC